MFMDRKKDHINIQFILIAAAFLIVFVLMGNAFPMGFHVTAEDVCVEAKCETGEAIIDSSQSRIIFCNDLGRIERLEQTRPLASEQISYWDIMAGNNAYYVIEFVNECGFVAKEQIVRYSARGVKEGVVLTRSYACPDDGVMQPRGYLIGTDEDIGYVAFSSDDLKSVSLLSFPLYEGNKTASEKIIAEYKNAAGGACISNLSINLEKGTIYAFGEDGSLWQMQPQGNAERLPVAAYTKETIELDEKTGEPVFSLDSEEKTFGSSFLFALKTVLFYASLIYLISSAVFFAVRSLIRTLREKTEDGLKRLRTVLLAISISVGAAVIVGAYSYNMAKAGIKDESDMIEITARNICYALRDDFTEAVQQYNDKNEEALAITTGRIKEKFNTMALFGAQGGHLQIPILLSLTDEGIPVALVGPDVLIQRGVEYPDFFKSIEGLTDKGGVTVISEENLWGAYLIAVTPLNDESGKSIGLVALYTDYELLKSVQLREILSLFFGLLSAAIAVAFIITEGRSWIKCFENYHISRKEGIGVPAVALVRPMFFLEAAAISADSAISALVAKELLAETPYAGNSVYLAMPMFASSLGLACGYLVFGALSSRIGTKKTTMSAIIFSAVMYLVTSLMVSQRNFFMYILSAFFAYLGAMASEVGIFRLILLAPDARSRADANRATAVSVVSANSLVGLAAGYTANYFGKAAVYLISFVPMAVYGIIYAAYIMKQPASLSVSARKTESSRPKMSKSERARDFVRFLFSPRIIALILFVIMPLCLSAGYKSYFFPLFAEGEGYDVSIISTVIVIANAIVYFITPAFSKAEETLGYQRISFICIFVLALTFGCFVFNKSMLWAVTALVIIGMVNKLGATCWKMLWPDEARAMDVSDTIGDSAVRSAYATCNVIKSPVLGVLKGLGNTTACAVIAAFSAVSAILFRLIHKKRV